MCPKQKEVKLNKSTLFLNAFLLALTRFVIMPIISAVLIIAGFFTNILATYIGIGFLVLYILLCLLFAKRVADAPDDEQ